MIGSVPVMLTVAALVLATAAGSSAQARNGDYFDRPQFTKPFGKPKATHSEQQAAAAEAFVETDDTNRLPENFGLKGRKHTPN